MSVAVELSGGYEGEAVLLDGEHLQLVCERAFAPGAPVELEARLEGGPLVLRGKSRGSRRRSDGRFDVGLRLVNVRRSEREALRAALHPD